MLEHYRQDSNFATPRLREDFLKSFGAGQVKKEEQKAENAKKKVTCCAVS